MMHTKNRIFLDSNILIYLYTSDEIDKTNIISALLQKHQNVLISTQVLFEFCYVVHRKLKVSYSHIEKALKEFSNAFEIIIITQEMISSALHMAEAYHYSFPDSLIITTAIKSKCDILLSEDMHNNHIIENKLTIINPFK